MDLKYFILFRNKLENIEITSFGFKGEFYISNIADLNLIKMFEDSEIRELYYLQNNSTVNKNQLIVNDQVVILIDLSKFNNYYETFIEFIKFNKYELKYTEFYIHDLIYQHKVTKDLKLINDFLNIQELISFLKSLSTYEKTTTGLLELFFQKPDKICSIIVDYDIEHIEKYSIQKSILDLKNHVFEKSDQETRRKIFSNEMINILSIHGFEFNRILKNWDNIDTSYRNSFQIYLSEFSFEKIKTSSQNYFHELTDRIYSTINKFSAYILAIPVAYILILRFFDFDGKSLAKDSFLVIIGILYFIIIWFVMLNNLSKAFQIIEHDIAKFIEKIQRDENLKEITDSLKIQKDKLIPSQKRKILLVRIISIITLLMIIFAYLFIYYDYFQSLILKA